MTLFNEICWRMSVFNPSQLTFRGWGLLFCELGEGAYDMEGKKQTASKQRALALKGMFVSVEKQMWLKLILLWELK